MLNSERFALAARLHVMLRRKAGRVTDTECLASNQDYAAEIVRFSTEVAKNGGHDDLAELVGKFATVMWPPSAPAATLKKTGLGHEDPGKIRYVGGIR
jgi:hypothetical protein